MPELPEVETTLRGIEPAVTSRLIERVVVREPRLRWRVPDELVALALEQGLLINVTADNVVRLLPPLVMQQDEARQLVDILAPLIKQFLAR